MTCSQGYWKYILFTLVNSNIQNKFIEQFEILIGKKQQLEQKVTKKLNWNKNKLNGKLNLSDKRESC